MSELPSFMRPAPVPDRRLARGAALAIVLGAAGLGAWRLVGDRHPAEAATIAVPVPMPVPIAATAAPGLVAPSPAAAPADDALRGERTRYVEATLNGPLETAFVDKLGRDLGAPLTQVVTRSLVWWVAIPGDLRRGDTVEVLFSERSGAEPLVHAVRLRSDKAQRTFEAFRFQPSGLPFARTYTRDGQEVELRLSDAPLDEHEQVTSLLRDGRGHKGVDFRTPTGTPVKATFDGQIMRKNWNRSNGTCLDVREQAGAGRSAYFLHLSEIAADVKVGDHVTKGQVIAKSGNTGHSFAPHLHYQLMSSSGALLDPFAGPTTRRALPAADRARFDEEVKRLDGLFAHGAELASAPPPAPIAAPPVLTR
jgi:murein DD-endopeptidase MepM/ murein hydrolase activator NlpD